MAKTSTILEHTQSPELYTLAGQLRHWRTTPRRGRRIPEALWEEAARLARTYGVSRVSAALRLSYYDLQRRARGGRLAKTRPPAQPTFVQLAAPALSGGSGQHGTVEIVHACGSRLILRLPDVEPNELLALVQAFLRHRP